MSLDDLLARYSPDRPLAERLALLVAMAARLPAPEFLWYDLAMQALHGPDDALRAPALDMLAHAPRSWHQVVMTGLTDDDPAVQTAALRALHTHAQADPDRREAFRALGDLPGWREENRTLWSVLMADLAGAASEGAAGAREMTIDEIAAWPPRPQGLDMTAVEPELAAELADAREAVATLEARVVDLEDENFMLRDDRARLGASYEAERRRAEQLGAELEELRARHEALHMELLNEIEQLRLNAERQDRQYVLKVTGLQEALDMARVRQRRTLTAGLLAFALVAAIGGPIAYSFATHASAMATSPEDVAGHTTVVAPVDVPPPARHDAPVRPVEPAAAVRPAPVERHVAPARPVVHHVPVAKPVVHGPAAKPVTAGAWPVKPRGVHAPVARPLGAHPAHPAHPAADPIPAFIRAKF